MICITDIDTPIQVGGGGGGAAAAEADPGQIAMLADMGFTASQAKKALRETVSIILIYQFFRKEAVRSSIDCLMLDISGQQRRTCYRVVVQSS